MDFNIQIIPDPVNFGLQLVATIILFAVISRFLYKPVNGLINERKKVIASNLAVAEKQKEEMAEIKSDYEAEILKARGEAKKIVDDSRAKGEEVRMQIIEQANEEAVQIKARAEKELEREREQNQRDMKDQIAEISMLVASKVIQKNLDNETQQKFIDQFIDEVGGS